MMPLLPLPLPLPLSSSPLPVNNETNIQKKKKTSCKEIRDPYVCIRLPHTVAERKKENLFGFFLLLR